MKPMKLLTHVLIIGIVVLIVSIVVQHTDAGSAANVQQMTDQERIEIHSNIIELGNVQLQEQLSVPIALRTRESQLQSQLDTKLNTLRQKYHWEVAKYVFDIAGCANDVNKCNPNPSAPAPK